MDVPGFHQRAEMPHEQRTQQGGDVQTVGIGIGEDADLAVAQTFSNPGTGVHADRHGDVVDLLRRHHLGGIHLPSIENLAA